MLPLVAPSRVDLRALVFFFVAMRGYQMIQVNTINIRRSQRANSKLESYSQHHLPADAALDWLRSSGGSGKHVEIGFDCRQLFIRGLSTHHDLPESLLMWATLGIPANMLARNPYTGPFPMKHV